MKHLYLIVVMLLALTNSHLSTAQMVGTTPVSYAGACDGTALFMDTANFNGWNWTWYEDDTSTVIASGGQTISNLCVGNYILILDSTGVESIVSFGVYDPDPCAMFTFITSSTNATPGNCDGTIQFTPIGGMAPYIYSVSGFPQQTAATITNLCAGIYTTYCTDANGCIVTTPIAVTASPPLAANVTYTNTNGTCTGTASAAPTGGAGTYAYLWSTNETTPSISGLCAGSYSVIIYDANQDTTSFSFTITDTCSNFTVTSSSTNSNTGYNNGSLEFTATGGSAPYLYSLSGSPFQTSSTFDYLFSGTYTIEVTDMTGCYIITTATVTDSYPPIIPNLTITNDSLFNCSGTASAAPTGGAGGYGYMWSTGQTTSSISGLCAGTHFVFIQDANLDTATFYFTITNPCSNIALSASATNCTPGNCDGAIQATVSGGTGPYAFSLSGGPQTGLSSFSNLCPGTYTLTVTDPNGCSAVVNATIIDSSVQTPIVPNLTTINDFTGNCSGFAAVAPTGGAGGYEYLWSTGSISNSITNLCVGAYTVLIIDSNQDTITVSFVITNPCQGFTGTASSTPASGPAICDGTSTFIASGGMAPYQYSWDNGVTFSPNATASNLCADVWDFICTDANGCLISQQITIVDSSVTLGNLFVNLTSTNDVTGNCTAHASVAASGGSAPYTYLWNTGDTTSAIYGLCAGSYFVTISDALNTDTLIQFDVTDCSGLVSSVSLLNCSPYPMGSCDGGIDFTPSGGTTPYSYLWSNGDTTQNLSDACPGSYSVVCTDALGCTASSIGSVFQDTLSPVNLNLYTYDDYVSDCNGAATVSPSGGVAPYNVLWSTGQTSTYINDLCSGIYSVTVWDQLNDSTTISFIIADSASLFGINYPNSGTINDTLYSDLVTNCVIDYNAIDSAALYQAVYDSINQNLYVTWAIYSPTDTIYISDTLGLVGNAGYYSINISVYCPNKSGNDFFKIESVIYFDGTNVWMSTLGLNEQDLLGKLAVYPNPVSNSISVDNRDGVIQSLKLIDLNGRILSEKSGVNSGLIALNDLETLSSGTYLLILSGADSSKTYKVIK